MENPQRPEYIRELALVLFDQTQPLHELDSMSRQVLELAALMVDQSLKLGKKKPMNAIRKQIKARYGEDITAEGQELLIPVVALQAGLLTRKAIIRLDLSPLQQRAILTLAALLKIAIGLDASASQSTVIQQVEVRRGDLWIVVDGPQVQLDIASAGHEARFWEKIGYPKINFLEMAEAQRIKAAYPPPLEITPVLPSDTLAEAGRKVMRQQYKMMLSQEEGTRLGEDIEALHDMRVATRRLRASFEVFGDSFEPEALKPHLKGLRAAGRTLGSVRDLDVFMEKAQRYLDSLPPDTPHNLDALLQEWQNQREQARAKMLAYLDSKEYQVFKDDFYIFVNTPFAGACPPPIGNPAPQLVCELVPALIYERLAAVRAYAPVIEDGPVEQLHALRIEFKKLRYTVEYFRDVLGPESKEIISEFKNLQDHLGDLNDAHVAIQILREFLAEYQNKFSGGEQPPELEIQAINDYIAFRQAEHDQLRQSFPAAWARFNRPEFMKTLALAVSVL